MPESLAVAVANILVERGLRVALAEASTCGLVTAQLGSLSGASSYLQGSVVAYSEQAKTEVLGLPASALAGGAVSPAAVQGMAGRVRKMFRADIGLAESGVADPGGGTKEKPVGLVYVALASASADLWERHTFTGERTAIFYHTADAVYDLLRRYLQAERPR